MMACGRLGKKSLPKTTLNQYWLDFKNKIWMKIESKQFLVYAFEHVVCKMAIKNKEGWKMNRNKTIFLHCASVYSFSYTWN